jgi:hypothetical protein
MPWTGYWLVPGSNGELQNNLSGYQYTAHGCVPIHQQAYVNGAGRADNAYYAIGVHEQATTSRLEVLVASSSVRPITITWARLIRMNNHQHSQFRLPSHFLFGAEIRESYTTNNESQNRKNVTTGCHWKFEIWGKYIMILQVTSQKKPFWYAIGLLACPRIEQRTPIQIWFPSSQCYCARVCSNTPTSHVNGASEADNVYCVIGVYQQVTTSRLPVEATSSGACPVTITWARLINHCRMNNHQHSQFRLHSLFFLLLLSGESYTANNERQNRRNVTAVCQWKLGVRGK